LRPPLLTRIRWKLDELRDSPDGKAVAAVAMLAVLVLGGFLAARAVAGSSSAAPSTQSGVRVVTMRQKVRVRVHGRLVTRWRLKKVYAKAQTVLETRTIHTPHGTRVVTRPVVHYHVVYRKRVIRRNGRTRTVLQPLTTTQTKTSTNTNTQLVTVTHQVTDTRTVTITQPVTVIDTTTVVSTQTQTETVPVTITVTLPVTTTG
jgi:hypothetical protein